MYPLFVPYYCDVPRVVMSQIWGIPMTGKSFSYILGLQVNIELVISYMGIGNSFFLHLHGR